MRQSITACLAGLILAIPSDVACASVRCICENNDSSATHVRQRVASSGATFLGQVETIIPGDSAIRRSALFRTTRWWKGSQADTVRILLRFEPGAPGTGTSCDATMNPGDRYVVFASDVGGGEFYAGVCDIREEKYASTLLRSLGDGTAPRRRGLTGR